MPEDNLNRPATLIPALSVGNTAVALFADTDALIPRRGVFIQPTNGEIAIGPAGVTTATGMLLGAYEKFFLNATAGANWYAVATGANGGANPADVRVIPVF